MFIASINAYQARVNSNNTVSFQGKRASAVVGALMGLTAAAHGNSIWESTHFIPIASFCTEDWMQKYARLYGTPCAKFCREIIKIDKKNIEISSAKKASLGRGVETSCPAYRRENPDLYWSSPKEKSIWQRFLELIS